MTKSKTRDIPQRHDRMTQATVAAVVAEISAYERKERDEPLSWAALQKFSGFTRVALWAKPEVKSAFQRARIALKPDATPTIKAPRTVDERINTLQNQLHEMRETIRIYDEQWILYEYNMQRLGLDPDELRRPLDSVQRHQIRARHIKAVK